jgi:serine/threonine protein kinase
MNSENQKNELFGKFRISETIKQSKQGGVYIAHHLFLEKKIFLKTINLDQLTDPVTIDRFKREARVLAKFDHPNIIKVYDFGNWENYFYISFEYFDAINLRELENERTLKDTDKLALTVQLVSGLNYAHKNRIIHRDLKPENILVNKDLKLKIADFGLALILNEPSVTEASSIVGTPAYMSPEQIRGEQLDERSDLFSLGILLLELFTGENPFLGKDTGSTLNNILTMDLSPDIDSNERLPEEIKPVLRQLLKNDRNKRTSSITGVPEELNIHEDQSGIGADSENIKKVSWLYKAIIPALIFLIILAVIIFNMRPQQKGISETSVQSSVDSLVISQSIPDSESKTEKTILKPDPSSKEVVSRTDLNKPDTQTTAGKEPAKAELLSGRLNVECLPWAKVYLDSRFLDSTPFNEPLNIVAGEHTIKLVHPNYPEYSKKIHLHPEETMCIAVNLDTTVGYFNCRVFPWGNVSIDSKLIGQTPLKQPVRLSPGRHNLTIKNPGYKEFSKEINIIRGDTLRLEFNFESVTNSTSAKM